MAGRLARQSSSGSHPSSPERLKMNTRDGLGGSEQRLVEANIMPGERVWELGWASLE
jgi:hypothetical protein